MKKFFVSLVVVIIAGCATNEVAMPSFEGKPRVKINQQVPVSAVTSPVTNDIKGE